MHDPDLAALLQLIAASAARREDVIPALRASAIAGATEVAAALEQGRDLPQALAAIAPAPVRRLLAGPRPPLERAALLAAAEASARHLRRRLWIERLAQPLTSCAIVAVMAWAMVHHWHLPLAPRCLWFGVPGALIIAAALVLPWCGEAIASRVSILGTWAYHLARAGMYERAAIAARWRMCEADIAALLGGDLARIAPALARSDAEDHCRRLAAYHHATGQRHARLLALTLATALVSLGGTIALALMLGLLHDYFALMRAMAS